MVISLRAWAVAAGIVAFAAALGSARAGSAATGAPVGPAASSVDRYESDWAYRVRPWQRRTVVDVTIERAGLGEAERKAADDPEPCTTFRPSEAQIRHFVARARRVSQRDYLHETDWSPCHAVGQVQFQGGVRAEWMVQRLGAGFVSIAGARHYLHCPDCALGVVGQRKAP